MIKYSAVYSEFEHVHEIALLYMCAPVEYLSDSMNTNSLCLGAHHEVSSCRKETKPNEDVLI